MIKYRYSNQKRVDRVDQFVFDREADASGSNYWTEFLTGEGQSVTNWQINAIILKISLKSVKIQLYKLILQMNLWRSIVNRI